jgi:hypothetical protein
MRLLKGNMEVVAPISAPMLQMVAMPVQESDSTPGPLYSTIAPVPPLTVRIPATFRITSISGQYAAGMTKIRYYPWVLSSR